MKANKCHFSTDITETLSCCLDRKFDEWGFAENICPEYPCDKYNQIVIDIEKHRQANLVGTV